MRFKPKDVYIVRRYWREFLIYLLNSFSMELSLVVRVLVSTAFFSKSVLISSSSEEYLVFSSVSLLMFFLLSTAALSNWVFSFSIFSSHSFFCSFSYKNIRIRGIDFKKGHKVRRDLASNLLLCLDWSFQKSRKTVPK